MSSLNSQIRELKKQQQNHPWMFARLADLLKLAGKTRQAEKVLTKGIKRYPNYVSGRHVNAGLLMQNGQEKAAMREFTAAACLIEGISSAWLERQRWSQKNDETDQYHRLIKMIWEMD